MKTTISFDVDGVVADFHKKLKQIAEEMYPHTAPIQDLSNWGLTPAELTLLHMTWKSRPNLFCHLDLCEGVDTHWLRDLNRRYRLLWLTARCETPGLSAYKQTMHWIQEYIGIHDPLVVVADDKVPVLHAACAILHVDDKVTTIAEIAGYNSLYACGAGAVDHHIEPILMAHSNNQNCTLWPRVDWSNLPLCVEQTIRDWEHTHG